MSESHASRAAALYHLSPYHVSPRLIRAAALVKEAAARCNASLGYLSHEDAEALVGAARTLQAMDDTAVARAFPLDAYQGGAGTSINMAINEWLVHSSEGLDPYAHANLHQSTNDVMPTALRLMMHDHLASMERECEALQSVLQEGEARYDTVVKPARTQLREALVTSVGREFAAWSHAVSRDRWRCFKARERIREVNLGGTAVGTGAGAPRRYVLAVTQHLQTLTPHAISRAEHLGEATSNYDQVVEAMEAPRSVAINLRRIAGDLRLLASGPRTAVGEVILPAHLEGSSIMAGKINPVIPEAVIQCAERVLSNDGLIGRFASQSELELNAFFPAVAHAVDESFLLAGNALRALTALIPEIKVDEARCRRGADGGFAQAVALLPLIDYKRIERLLGAADEAGEEIGSYLVARGLFDETDANAIFSPEHLLSLGYDEQVYQDIAARCGAALRDHVDRLAEGSAPW